MMMRYGIMIFNALRWKIWIGQQEYETMEGMKFEIRIQDDYYVAFLGKDDEWFVTIEEDVCFVLRTLEVYKVRIVSDDLILEGYVPF